MSKNHSETLEKILKRLDLLLYILIRDNTSKINENKLPIREVVKELYTYGIPINDISDILNKSRNSIDLHLNALRKSGKIDMQKKENIKIETNEMGRKTNDAIGQ